MIFYSKHTALVLLLHRVLPVRDAMWDPMDPKLFERTLQYVQKHFHVIALQELLFHRPAVSSKPLAAITFDDGYRDFIDYSIPLLKKYNIPASMFVTTDCIENNLPTWTYLLDTVFEKSGILCFSDFDASALPAEYSKTNWGSAAERIAYGKKIKQHLKWIPSLQRKKIINAILKNLYDVTLPVGMMMGWDEVRQAQAAGYEIGAHSVSHPTLATLEDDVELDYELNYSAQQLHEKAGIEKSVFSYPCGSYDERVMAHTQRAGYKAGLAVDRKLYEPMKDNIYAVPRIELYNESWLKAGMRMNGTISFIEKFIKN